MPWVVKEPDPVEEETLPEGISSPEGHPEMLYAEIDWSNDIPQIHGERKYPACSEKMARKRIAADSLGRKIRMNGKYYRLVGYSMGIIPAITLLDCVCGYDYTAAYAVFTEITE